MQGELFLHIMKKQKKSYLRIFSYSLDVFIKITFGIMFTGLSMEQVYVLYMRKLHLIY